MAIKTQGTQLYTIDPDTGAVLEVECALNIDGVDTTNSTVDITCLSDLARRFMAGLAEPGSANFTINSDPKADSHIRLHQLKVRGDTLPWAIGWSDGFGIAPTSALNTDGTYDFVLPTTRTWLLFEGFMTSYPFTFAGNSAVNSNIAVQVSGEVEWIPQAT